MEKKTKYNTKKKKRQNNNEPGAGTVRVIKNVSG